jgi:glycosyltransferase involved in cell wall biosynthesis
LLTLPDGEWRRRMRRGAQDLAPAALEMSGEFEFIVATDLLDLPLFLALTRRRFGNTPVMLYMHENQFTYPRIRGTKFNSWFGQINYTSALAADVVAFNSDFHRRDFFGALRTLAAQPNNWLSDEGIEAIAAKSRVLPVGVDLAWMDKHRQERPEGRPPRVLWNHRWEFDKAPEMFVRAVRTLIDEGLNFEVAVAGEPGFNPSDSMLQLPEIAGERLVQYGRVESAAKYAELLWSSDIVVSTTRHEFFGVAMVEALYCGCFPVLPRQFTYPDLVPPTLHAECLFDDEEGFVDRLRVAIERPLPETADLRAAAERFAWPAVIREWDDALEQLSGVTIPRHSGTATQP